MKGITNNRTAMATTKILIDLIKLREMSTNKTEGVDPSLLNGGALKTIRELATFQYTCRRCKDAPCVNVCPADALEKNENGMVNRALNLCIRCKSCVPVCPFGTIMNDFFEVETSGFKYYDLSDEEELKKFVASFPEEVVSVMKKKKNGEENIYELSDQVWIREYAWSHEQP